MNRILASLLLVVGLSTTAFAQQFSIQRMQITTSGGSMSGGEFGLTGAIQKHDPSPALNGGDFALDGAASSISVAVHSSGYPELQLRITAASVELTWAIDDAVGHILQSTTHLGSAAVWQNEPVTAVIADGRAKAILPRRPGLRFYRLQRPSGE